MGKECKVGVMRDERNVYLLRKPGSKIGSLSVIKGNASDIFSSLLLLLFSSALVDSVEKMKWITSRTKADGDVPWNVAIFNL